MTTSRIAAAIVIAAGVLWWSALPRLPLAEVDAASELQAPVRGVIHVHSRRSDGTGTIDSIARAAARAGLQFVIVTDHGDATREPDPPRYLHDVLCIEAVEISSNGGHVVALDLPPSPYPLGGDARDVLEDVRRLGGFSIAAHPDSMRAGLSWADWDAPFDGLEWLSGDSQWRDETWFDLGRALLTYPVRPAATVTALLDRPDALMQRWDALTLHRPVVGIAASDAHARMGSGPDPYPNAISIHAPSYEQVFRSFSISLPGVRLNGSPGEDSQAVIQAIREGRIYSTIDGLAMPAVLDFQAAGAHEVDAGGSMAHGDRFDIRVKTNAPAGSQVVLLKNGEAIRTSPAPGLDYTGADERGVFRVEVRLAGTPGSAPVPWIVSNPIYIGMPLPGGETGPARPPATTLVSRYTDGPADDWRVEKSPRSEGALHVAPTVDGTQLSLRWGLGGTLSESPHVAAVVPAGPALAGADRLIFTARSVRPMRLSVQLRAADASQDRRWRRSVYLDETARTVTVFLNEMKPVATGAGPPDPSVMGDILFVVDTVNNAPGSSGQIWLDDVQYGRPDP